MAIRSSAMPARLIPPAGCSPARAWASAASKHQPGAAIHRNGHRAPAPAAATEAVDSLVSGASLGLPDLSTLATDISGLFDPSTALADFSNLVTDILSALQAAASEARWSILPAQD